MLDVAVIIPFFQRKPKLLGLTIASIMAQRIDDTRFTIVVVDDGSPVPAQAVLDDIPIADPHRLVLVRQPNGGPGAARNRGIEEALKLAPDYMAFIDSDDVWAPDHIARAIDALRTTGGDWYFSDILNDGQPGFRSFRYMRANLRPEEFDEPVSKTLDSHVAVNAIATECMPHMTTIVCRPGLLEHVRFDERFRRACEDQLFFVDLARASWRVTFSTALAGERGEGVSIYREAMSWGSASAPLRLLDELAYRQRSLFAGDLKPSTKYRLCRSGQIRTNHFVFLFVRNLSRSPKLSFSSMLGLIRRVPVFIPSVAVAFVWLPMYYRNLKLRLQDRV
jgi:succinoglycan biosynthesis protein ExoW